jgi:hypothetical protein
MKKKRKVKITRNTVALTPKLLSTSWAENIKQNFMKNVRESGIVATNLVEMKKKNNPTRKREKYWRLQRTSR